MLLNPPVMALVLVSLVVSLMLLLASGFAWQVIRRWDLQSGSETQLVLERRTYLISTLVSWAFVAELVSLLLFIYNAEAMSGQFVGAMCATGVLNVNPWGWPTLFLKIAVFFLGAAWLALNRLDNQGYDYPLIRTKYLLLLFITPWVVAEFVVQLRHFLDMNPEVITSCCGSLFSADSEGVAAEVSGVAPRGAAWMLYGSGALMIMAGLACWKGWCLRGSLLSVSAVAAFASALVAIVSFVALYVYEHPHHHCPFCLLKSGHDYVGYLLYVPLFAATALSLAAGVTAWWGRAASLRDVAAREVPRLAILATGLFVIFYLVSTWLVARSSLVMSGVWW